MIDFSELPEDGIKFEQLIREILSLEGFDIHWTGAGQDEGRDLIITEELKGKLSTYERKWLVSCKHTAISGKSLGRTQVGNIIEDCKAIGAQGYILACSTQPTASLVKRLEEIEKNQNIITKFWDCIEIENRLTKPNTFSLIHTFFPKSSEKFRWKIYNAFSPAFWAANYKNYFFYMSCRHSNTYPSIKNMETIISLIEKIPIQKVKNYYYDSHFLRPRAIYYDDKHCTHIAYVDYIFPSGTSKEKILNPQELEDILFKLFTQTEHQDINQPDWDFRYIEESTGSDSFQLDHKSYYEPYTKQFEKGLAREDFLYDMAYKYDLMKDVNIISPEDLVSRMKKLRKK